MNFEHPFLFFLLIIPTLIFAYLVLTNKNGVERVFPAKILQYIKVENAHLSTRARNVLLFLSAFFMIVAIAHPYIKKGDVKVSLQGQNLILALNISKSMRSKDRYPNRLEFAKAKIETLFDLMPQDEISFITFANDVYLISPSTSDKETLKEVLHSLNTKYLQGEANYTKLITILAKMLKNKLQKSAIIVTDSTSSADSEAIEKIIKKHGIKLYIIYVATPKGAPLLDKNDKLILKNDKLIISALDTKLGEIAKKYGGDYVVADYSNDAIKELVATIKSNSLFLDEKKEVTIKQRVELFYYPLIIAFLLLIAALSSIPKENIFYFRKKQ